MSPVVLQETENHGLPYVIKAPWNINWNHTARLCTSILLFFCQQEFVSWKMRISQNQPRAVRKLLVAPFLPENAWPLSFGPHACVFTPYWVVPGDDKNPLLLYTWATPPKSALWENNRLAAFFYYKYSPAVFQIVSITPLLKIPICTFHDGCKQGIVQQMFNRKWISRKITHP